MDTTKHRRMYFTNIHVTTPAQYMYNVQKAEYETTNWSKSVDANYIIEEIWADGSVHKIFDIHVSAFYSQNAQTITFDTPEISLSDETTDLICEFIRQEITHIG